MFGRLNVAPASKVIRELQNVRRHQWFGFSCGFWLVVCAVYLGGRFVVPDAGHTSEAEMSWHISRVSTLLPFLRSIVAVFFFDVCAQLVLSTNNWLRLPLLPQQKKGWGQNTGHIVMLGKAGDAPGHKTVVLVLGPNSIFRKSRIQDPKYNRAEIQESQSHSKLLAGMLDGRISAHTDPTRRIFDLHVLLYNEFLLTIRLHCIREIVGNCSFANKKSMQGFCALHHYAILNANTIEQSELKRSHTLF